VKIDGVPLDVMFGPPACLFRDLAMQGHVEVADRAAALAHEVAVIADDRVVTHDAIADIPAGNPAILQQNADVPVEIAQADGRHFFPQKIVQPERCRMILAG
jgi:hypothetical protein